MWTFISKLFQSRNLVSVADFSSARSSPIPATCLIFRTLCREPSINVLFSIMTMPVLMTKNTTQNTVWDLSTSCASYGRAFSPHDHHDAPKQTTISCLFYTFVKRFFLSQGDAAKLEKHSSATNARVYSGNCTFIRQDQQWIRRSYISAGILSIAAFTLMVPFHSWMSKHPYPFGETLCLLLTKFGSGLLWSAIWGLPQRQSCIFPFPCPAKRKKDRESECLPE